MHFIVCSSPNIIAHSQHSSSLVVALVSSFCYEVCRRVFVAGVGCSEVLWFIQALPEVGCYRFFLGLSKLLEWLVLGVLIFRS